MKSGGAKRRVQRLLYRVVGVVFVGHPRGFGRVPFAFVRIVYLPEVVGRHVERGSRVALVGETGERTLLAVVPLPVGRGVDEDDEVLFLVERGETRLVRALLSRCVVGIGAFDQPDPDFLGVGRHDSFYGRETGNC